MKAKCTSCGLYYQISRYATIPKSGYICPVCAKKERRPVTAITKAATKK